MRGGAAVLVSSGVQRGSVSAAVSYDAPSVSSAGVSNVASSGAMSVSVSGRGMGVGGLSAVGRVGGSACGASVWRSDSGLLCRVISGCFSGQVVLASLGMQRGSMSAAVSFDAPSVSSAALSNVVTSGFVSVTVVGGGFAVYGGSSGGRMLFSAASATLWISGSSVVARCGAGLGTGGSVAVSVGLQGGSLTLALSFDAVKVSSVSLMAVAVSGASSVEVFGHSIGVVGASAKGRIGASSTMGSAWAADSAVACRVSRGVGKPVHIVVSAMRQIGSLSFGLSFAVPSLSSVRMTNAASTCGSSVTVAGRGFGSAGYSVGMNVGGTSCEVSRWIAESSILCKVSGSARPSASLSSSVGLQASGALSAALSYNLAAVRFVSPGNAGSSGSSSLTVVGMLFGTWDRSAHVRIQNSAASSTGWIADSSVVCRAVSGLSGALRAIVSAAGQRGSVSAAVSYDAPSVSSAGVSNVASSGAMSVSVCGRGMGVGGLSAVGGVGGSACGASVWRSDSGLVCRVAGGLPGGFGAVVSAGVQRGSMSAAVSYDAPSVSSAGVSNVASSGGMSVSVVGRGGMGVSGSSASARLGLSACEGSGWVSDSGVVCKAAGGVSVGAVGVVSAGVVRGSASVLLSYDRPSVSAAGVSNVASSGGVSVTVVGRGGAGASGASSKVRVGGTACVGSVWQSDSGVVCRSASGGFPDRPVAVSCGRQHGSASLVLSYNAPVVSSVGLSNAASSGGTSVTVYGLNGFGVFGHSQVFKFGFTTSPSSFWVCSSTITCKAPSGSSSLSSSFVSVMLQTGSFSSGLSYNTAVLFSGLNSMNGPTSGSVYLNVAGYNFQSTSFASHSARIGMTSLPAVTWISESNVVCKTISGEQNKIKVMITLDRHIGSITKTTSFDKPTVININHNTNNPNSGSVSLTVAGAGLGASGYSGAGRVGRSGASDADMSGGSADRKSVV